MPTATHDRAQMADERVKIFVSSPSDVEHERAAVKDVVARLASEYLPYFELHTVLWEEEALTADRTFQAGLTQPADCEIVLVILWTRLGSPLPEEPYRGMTGTEWEFVTAVEASARNGAPEVLVYKKTAPKLVDITEAATAREAVEDRRRLDDFFRTHFFNEDNSFRRAFRTFDSDAGFRELVEVQLRKLLNRRISAERRASAGALRWEGSPFRPDRPFDVGDERVFTGREGEIRALLSHLGARPPSRSGLLLLSGASASGKTSLLRAGLVPRLTRPFLFEQVATVRCVLVDPARDGPTPLAALARRLVAPSALGEALARFGLDEAALTRLLASEPTVAARQLVGALRALAKLTDADADARLAVIVDPLQDVLVPDDAAAAPALAALAAALTGLAAHPQIWVIGALRSDALAQLATHPTLAPLAAAERFELEPLGAARIRQVVEIPARVAGLELDAAGAGGLVEQIEAEASELRLWAPPVQALLDQAYDVAAAEHSKQGAAPRLGSDGLRAVGGIAGHVLARADALWAALDADTRSALPRLCRALISIDGGVAARPGPRRGDLRTLRRDPAARRLLEALLGARLVIAEGVPDPTLLVRCEPPREQLALVLRGAWHWGRGHWRRERPRGMRRPLKPMPWRP